MIIKIHYKGSYSFVVEMMKWLCIIILLMIASIGGSYLYHGFNFLYKILFVFFIVILAGYLFFLTYHGRLVFVFAKESREEIRKVIWPTFRESFYTTMVVIFVTVIMSLILWGLDSMLVYVVSLFLGL